MDRLRSLRNEYALSQQKLAEQVGLSQQQVYAYEAGINAPDIETLKLLANFFGTSVDYLVDNTPLRQKIEAVQPEELNEAEMAFIHAFRKIPPHLRSSLSYFIQTLTEKPS